MPEIRERVGDLPKDFARWGHATGEGGGYVVGYTFANDDESQPIEMLRVHVRDKPACLIGLKYSKHKRGEDRIDRSPPTENYTRITMLVAGGPWFQVLQDDSNRIALRLNTPGDFIAWKEPEIGHFWTCEDDATMMTLTYRFLT